MNSELLEKKLLRDLKQAFVDWYHGEQISYRFQDSMMYSKYLSKIKVGTELMYKMQTTYNILFDDDLEDLVSS